jgi:hypothetical protein
VEDLSSGDIAKSHVQMKNDLDLGNSTKESQDSCDNKFPEPEQDEKTIPFISSSFRNSFTRKGKTTCRLKVARSKVEYVCAFQDLGKQMTVDQGAMSYLQKFVYYLYGQENEIDVDNARHNLFKIGNCTEETLPPTSGSLVQHIHHANYESYVKRRYRVQIVTAGGPDGHGRMHMMDLILTM